MTILLLGATGYLGGNIAWELNRRGYQLVYVVRRTSDTSRLESIGGEFISNGLDELEIFFKHRKVDFVINGVCTYKPNQSFYGDMLDSNILFPLSVLNLAVKYGVRNFVSMGTSLPDVFSLYSFTKCKFGDFGEFLSRTDGINFADLKLEMFYGGRWEPDNRFISSVKKRLLENEDIPLTQGTQKRDIIRVEDVCGIVASLISTSYLKGYMSLPVGSGEQRTIREIVQTMKNMLHSDSKLLFGQISPRQGEPDTLAEIGWYDKLEYQLKHNHSGFYRYEA